MNNIEFRSNFFAKSIFVLKSRWKEALVKKINKSLAYFFNY